MTLAVMVNRRFRRALSFRSGAAVLLAAGGGLLSFRRRGNSDSGIV
jgi:hypothetical protein